MILTRKKKRKDFNSLISSKTYFRNPFLKSLRFHQDGIVKLISHPTVKNVIFTGSFDGEICSWILNKEKCFFNFKAHEKSVRGLAIDHGGKFLLSCSEDSTVKLWKIMENMKNPLKLYKSDTSLNSIAFNPLNSYFITTGKSITVWDFYSFFPIQQILQKEVSISCAKFNPLEHNILLSTASDRSIMLYDLRIHSPVKKFFMEMRTNDITWFKTNPWEFTLANEDSNLYTFDLRKINRAKKIYKGHVMAVQSLDQDGKNGVIVSGSLDKTIRLHHQQSDLNLNILSSSRMSRVLCVAFSLDYNLILSGSEDGNLRLWKKPETRQIFDLNSIKSSSEKRIQFKDYRFTRFQERFFLPKLILNIHKIKNKISTSTYYKKMRIKEHVLPGTISLKEGFKKPIINSNFEG